MKKVLFIALAIASLVTTQAQTRAYNLPKFSDNWSLGIDGGVTTPLKGGGFFSNMRGSFGLHVQKQVTPVIGIGLEATLDVNTASWLKNNPNIIAAGYDLSGQSTSAIDRMYVGAYASANLFNLLGGYNCEQRFFDIDLVAGAGWGRIDVIHQNYFATKAGINLNFNFSREFTLSFKPSVSFNMTGTEFEPLNVNQTSAAYNRNKANFNFVIGFTYHFGRGFTCADTNNQGEIDALNAKINTLRGELDACLANTAANNAKVNALKSELEACKNRKPQVIEKVSNNLQSVRYIFYKIGSSKISADQQPNVEMVANYLKNHKDAKVVVKGYASKDGNAEFNKKLAEARAESVKNTLVKKYKIEESRIEAKGEGIGEMFSENDWNRVSICTLN